MATADPSTSGLLALPAELRNVIYRLTLLDECKTVRVNRRTCQEAALLQTCKQTRHEGLPIFYAENTFIVNIDAFDSGVLIAITKVFDNMRLHYDINPRFRLFLDWVPHWANLMLWLERYHAGRTMPNTCRIDELKSIDEETDVEHALIVHMFDTAEEFGDLPWVRVKKVLMGIRELLAVEDDEWAEDKA